MHRTEFAEIARLEHDGHSAHCARRIVWGDGECTCAKSLYDRILERVEFVPWTGCWIWTGALDHKGYGRIWLRLGGRRRGRSARVHRLVYRIAQGPRFVFPADLVLDHRCRERACCNPVHLELVTVRVNTLRGNGPTALRYRQRLVAHTWGSEA